MLPFSLCSEALSTRRLPLDVWTMADCRRERDEIRHGSIIRMTESCSSTEPELQLHTVKLTDARAENRPQAPPLQEESRTADVMATEKRRRME